MKCLMQSGDHEQPTGESLEMNALMKMSPVKTIIVIAATMLTMTAHARGMSESVCQGVVAKLDFLDVPKEVSGVDQVKPVCVTDDGNNFYINSTFTLRDSVERDVEELLRVLHERLCLREANSLLLRSMDYRLDIRRASSSAVEKSAKATWQSCSAIVGYSADVAQDPNDGEGRIIVYELPASKSNSYLEQLNQAQRKDAIAQQYKGRAQGSSEILNSAKNRTIGNSNSCPKGSTIRKSEDVRHYLVQQDLIQTKLSTSMSRFTSKAIVKREAINELNQLIQEHNALVLWGRMKVTDGACGSPRETEIIAKAYGTSRTLIKDYKNLVEAGQ